MDVARTGVVVELSQQIVVGYSHGICTRNII